MPPSNESNERSSRIPWALGPAPTQQLSAIGLIFVAIGSYNSIFRLGGDSTQSDTLGTYPSATPAG